MSTVSCPCSPGVRSSGEGEQRDNGERAFNFVFFFVGFIYLFFLSPSISFLIGFFVSFVRNFSLQKLLSPLDGRKEDLQRNWGCRVRFCARRTKPVCRLG